MPALNRLYREYRDRVEFYIVYIEEAHPIDLWQTSDNLEDDVLVATTRTADERYRVAGLCLTKLGIELRALVDEPDNRVERAYTAWPDCFYVIDRDGLIPHKSAAGPFGFKPADVEATLKRIVAAAPRERWYVEATPPGVSNSSDESCPSFRRRLPPGPQAPTPPESARSPRTR